jgi:hypothetical protein
MGCCEKTTGESEGTAHRRDLLIGAKSGMLTPRTTHLVEAHSNPTALRNIPTLSRCGLKVYRGACASCAGLHAHAHAKRTTHTNARTQKRTHTRTHKTACCTRARPRPAHEFKESYIAHWMRRVRFLQVFWRLNGRPGGASPCKVVSRDGRIRLDVSDVPRLGSCSHLHLLLVLSMTHPVEVTI